MIFGCTVATWATVLPVIEITNDNTANNNALFDTFIIITFCLVILIAELSYDFVVFQIRPQSPKVNGYITDNPMCTSFNS